MSMYVRKVTPAFEAYQWDGMIPFRPAPNFVPDIVHEGRRGYPNTYELLTSRFSYSLIKEDDYVAKDSKNRYYVITKEEFEALYKKVEEDNE